MRSTLPRRTSDRAAASAPSASTDEVPELWPLEQKPNEQRSVARCLPAVRKPFLNRPRRHVKKAGQFNLLDFQYVERIAQLNRCHMWLGANHARRISERFPE